MQQQDNSIEAVSQPTQVHCILILNYCVCVLVSIFFSRKCQTFFFISYFFFIVFELGLFSFAEICVQLFTQLVVLHDFVLVFF